MDKVSFDNFSPEATIGRNFTEKYYRARGQQLAFTGIGAASGTVAGGTPADAYAALNRGQEIMLGVNVAFGR